MKERLDRVLRQRCPRTSWTALRRLIASGKVSVDGRCVTDPAHLVLPGADVSLRMTAPDPRRRSPLGRGAVVYLDAHLVIVNKPPGVSTVPYHTERGTLDELVRAELKRRAQTARADAPLGIVHRLDKETSGLLVFARTLAAKRALSQQFREHSIERRYVALAHGRVRSTTFRSRLVADRGDGRRGSTDNPRLGRLAVTHVRALRELGAATLIECRLETGRTHQIRIHLSEAGHPLLGERVYVRGLVGELLPAPRLMLHAEHLGFLHPATGARLAFSTPMPEDMARRVEELVELR